VVRVTNPYGRIHGFLHRSRSSSSIIQLNPVPDQLLPRKSGSVGDRTRASGSVARNSHHLTTEVGIDNLTEEKYLRVSAYRPVV
jgi:hypothetical protein